MRKRADPDKDKGIPLSAFVSAEQKDFLRHVMDKLEHDYPEHRISLSDAVRYVVNFGMAHIPGIGENRLLILQDKETSHAVLGLVSAWLGDEVICDPDHVDKIAEKLKGELT